MIPSRQSMGHHPSASSQYGRRGPHEHMRGQKKAMNTKIVTDYLESKGLAAPSFDVDGLDEYPIPPTEEVPFKARLKLISLTKEMHDLALGPKEGLRFLAWDVRRSITLFRRSVSY